MRNRASAILVGNEIYKTNDIVIRLSEEISGLSSRLNNIKNLNPSDVKRQKEIIDMIKIRCELLGTLSKSFE
jgi:hypothetical protein